jgi:putative glutamine amidotransferase
MKNSKPNIFINLCTKTGDEMFYIRRGYIEALTAAGAVPITLPLMADREFAAHVIELADGVLLPGSITDVDPKLYHEEVSPYYGQKGPERDQSDFYLLEKAFEKKIPVFGICFGHQSLNVFCGGSLYQDLPHDVTSDVVHWQDEPYNLPVHNVTLKEDTLMHRIFGTTELPVNSIHHQGVKTVGNNLRASAYSPDGIVEAYENRNGGQFLMGVQWHPERMWQDDPQQFRLFEEFVGAARKWRQENR